MTRRLPQTEPTVALVQRARSGDAEAYDELFVRAAERLRFYLRVRLGASLRAREDSGDLLQETFLAAHRAFAGFEHRGEGAFVRWLCRIAENCIRARADHHAADRRRSPAELERLSRVGERLEAPGEGPATLADRSERHVRLTEALAELPVQEREALLLRHFEGRSIDEVADALGTSATSARRLIGRATVRLGDVLAARENER